MKQILTAALSIFPLAARIKQHGYLLTIKIDDDNKTMQIEDDNKRMSIRVKTKNTGHPVDYKESFDVRRMNNLQKKELQNLILDSLGVEKLN